MKACCNLAPRPCANQQLDGLICRRGFEGNACVLQAAFQIGVRSHHPIGAGSGNDHIRFAFQKLTVPFGTSQPRGLTGDNPQRAAKAVWRLSDVTNSRSAKLRAQAT